MTMEQRAVDASKQPAGFQTGFVLIFDFWGFIPRRKAIFVFSDRGGMPAALRDGQILAMSGGLNKNQ
jgi:hypothetical protein